MYTYSIVHNSSFVSVHIANNRRILHTRRNPLNFSSKCLARAQALIDWSRAKNKWDLRRKSNMSSSLNDLKNWFQRESDR
jgi:hypothetical protein